MIISVIYLVVRCLLGCLMMLTQRQVSKDAELLVLRTRTRCSAARSAVCVPRIPSTALTSRVGLPSCLAVTIIGHVPAVRLPSHNADDHVAAANPA